MELDKIEVTHKCFKIMNQLKEKYNWDVMLKNSADTMGIESKILENIITETDLYKFNKEEQKYILKNPL